ncbi:hypothetical protein H0W91_03125 [Patescibacteria group bacterium]|nr:hypothetical protein [Patescibacteria group bacterium]
MKKTILNTLITFLAFGGASLAYAETTVGADVNFTSSSTRPLPFPTRKVFEARKAMQASTTEAIKAMRERAKADIKDIRDSNASSSEKRAEIKDRKIEERKEIGERRMENRFDKMTARFTATIEREESIMAKINSRIEKIKAAGGNTTEAEKLVLEAKVHFDAAKATFSSLAVASQTTVSLENTSSTTNKEDAKSALNNLKMLSKELEKHIREGHEALTKVVASLKSLNGLNGQKVEASTTVNTRN